MYKQCYKQKGAIQKGNDFRFNPSVYCYTEKLPKQQMYTSFFLSLFLFTSWNGSAGTNKRRIIITKKTWEDLLLETIYIGNNGISHPSNNKHPTYQHVKAHLLPKNFMETITISNFISRLEPRPVSNSKHYLLQIYIE